MLVLLLAGVALAHTAPPLPDSKIAQPRGQFSLPFPQAPGPATWLLGQPYGNTVGAYRQGRSLYAAIQGIHFGIDFSAPCGTPVHVIADGTVVDVDGPHGSPPHSLVVDHGNGLSSLYGHLLRRPSLEVGAKVKRGQVVALSGDSQLTCVSAPHLHLEIRDSSHVRLFNPIPYLSADWPTLFLAGTTRASGSSPTGSPRPGAAGPSWPTSPGPGRPTPPAAARQASSVAFPACPKARPPSNPPSMSPARAA